MDFLLLLLALMALTCVCDVQHSRAEVTYVAGVAALFNLDVTTDSVCAALDLGDRTLPT